MPLHGFLNQKEAWIEEDERIFAVPFAQRSKRAFLWELLNCRAVRDHFAVNHHEPCRTHFVETFLNPRLVVLFGGVEVLKAFFRRPSFILRNTHVGAHKAIRRQIIVTSLLQQGERINHGLFGLRVQRAELITNFVEYGFGVDCSGHHGLVSPINPLFEQNTIEHCLVS